MKNTLPALLLSGIILLASMYKAEGQIKPLLPPPAHQGQAGHGNPIASHKAGSHNGEYEAKALTIVERIQSLKNEALTNEQKAKNSETEARKYAMLARQNAADAETALQQAMRLHDNPKANQSAIESARKHAYNADENSETAKRHSMEAEADIAQVATYNARAREEITGIDRLAKLCHTLKMQEYVRQAYMLQRQMQVSESEAKQAEAGSQRSAQEAHSAALRAHVSAHNAATWVYP